MLVCFQCHGNDSLPMIAILTFPSVATIVMVIIIIDYDNDDCELNFSLKVTVGILENQGSKW